METKFTKGNWIFSKYEPTDFSVHSEEGSGNDIALVRGSNEESEANAKLITQSPALLENLQNMLFAFRSSAKSEIQKAAIKYADDAIKKAIE